MIKFKNLRTLRCLFRSRIIKMTYKQKLWGLVGWIALSMLVSSIGALASVQAQDFYNQLSQPTWAPPPWLFGPVWTALYLLMALSAWLVWCQGGYQKNSIALNINFLQLFLNAGWSWLFFYWKSGILAFVEIFILLVFIGLTIKYFYARYHLAGLLLIPYFIWVSFAAALNVWLWQLNPNLL